MAVKNIATVPLRQVALMKSVFFGTTHLFHFHKFLSFINAVMVNVTVCGILDVDPRLRGVG